MTKSVAIAISSFRSDASVVRLLKEILDKPHPEVGAIIVVDSLGSGKISEIAEANKWQITYENASANLGSAGNLARRMELAAGSGAEWCLCLNHDANWAADRLSAMLAAAKLRDRVGAVYPILDHSPREPRWEHGRKHFRPSAGDRSSYIPHDNAVHVLWGSSNFALYATSPFKENVKVFADLWMGYEDLAYGISLHQSGWHQISCPSAQLSGIFDYGSPRFLGRTLYIPEKPIWYSYYNIRNLILIRRQYGSPGVSHRSIWAKFIQSGIRILLLEDNKLSRLRLLFSGVVDGILGKSGKGFLP